MCIRCFGLGLVLDTVVALLFWFIAARWCYVDLPCVNSVVFMCAVVIIVWIVCINVVLFGSV